MKWEKRSETGKEQVGGQCRVGGKEEQNSLQHLHESWTVQSTIRPPISSSGKENTCICAKNTYTVDDEWDQYKVLRKVYLPNGI